MAFHINTNKLVVKKIVHAIIKENNTALDFLEKITNDWWRSVKRHNHDDIINSKFNLQKTLYFPPRKTYKVPIFSLLDNKLLYLKEYHSIH